LPRACGERDTDRLLITRSITVAVCSLVACIATDNDLERQEPAYTTPGYAAVGDSVSDTPLRFTDVTRSAGITFVHETGAFGSKWMPETMGSGGGFLDYNIDGLPDLFLVNGSEWPGHASGRPPATPRLYRNLGNGKFDDVTAEARLDFSIYGMGVAFADYDADGDPDIYVTAVGDNKLLRNDNGVFVDVTLDAAVTGNDEIGPERPSWSTAAAWVDVDRDGRVDLFVCSYVRWTPETDLYTTLDGKNKSYATPQQYQGDTCRLYQNLDGRRFSDVTAKAGILNSDGKSLGIAVTDVNDDGWSDLVVANDTERNFLYLNNGDGTFTDIGLRAGLGFDEFGRARAGMGVDVADITSNGKLSVVIGNFSREPLSLFRQIGIELFQDFAGNARLTRESLLMLTFGVVFADLDLDGYLDLVTGNGHIEPEINGVQQDVTFAQPPQIFLNNGRGQFSEVGDQVNGGFAEPIVGRGIAYADIDLDGDLDLLITVNGSSPKLLRNELPDSARSWVGIAVRGRVPNREAIGAVVTLYSGGLVQQRMVRTGSSYLSQSDNGTQLFGLGSLDLVDSVVVRWPSSGKTTTFGPITAGRRYLVREDKEGADPEVVATKVSKWD
jgi:hypothetical protein